MSRPISNQLTEEYIPTRPISISVYSPGILNRDIGKRVSTSFSSSKAPRTAIILSRGNVVGPTRRCGS